MGEMMNQNDWYVEKDESDFTVKYYDKQEFHGNGSTSLIGSKENTDKWKKFKENNYVVED